MNAIQRELDNTYQHTLAVLAGVKRKAYRSGFIDGVVVVLAAALLWWALTQT